MTTRNDGLVQIALYAAIIAALGLLPKFNIPVAGGIAITAQSLGVMLAGVMLSPLRATLSVGLFLFVVALGAPLLAGGRGGIGIFAGPSVGFLVGFPAAAFVTAMIMYALRNLPVILAALIASIGGGVGVLYLLGIPGLSIMTDMTLEKAFTVCLVFIPGDLAKAVVVALIAQAVMRGLPGALPSRR